MAQPTFTPRSCELGAALRTIREHFATGREFAEQLDWDESKVSNIERGKVRPTDVDLAQYLTACGNDRRLITEFSEHYRQAFEPYFAQGSDNFSTVSFAERTAETVTGYGRTTLPELLRTDEYTEQLLRGRGVEPEQVQLAIQSQRQRQRSLRTQGRPSFLFYIAEAAMTAHLDDARAWMDQFELLRSMSQFLRIIPARNGLPPLVNFTIFEGEKAPTTVLADCDFAKIFIQGGAAVLHCRTVLTKLNELALSHADSRTLLGQLLSEEYVAGIKAATGEQSVEP